MGASVTRGRIYDMTSKERNEQGYFRWSELSSPDMTLKELVASLTEKQRKALVELLKQFNEAGKPGIQIIAEKGAVE